VAQALVLARRDLSRSLASNDYRIRSREQIAWSSGMSDQTPMPNQTRCSWAKTPIEIDYHDQEWGVPLHDDRKLFEFLILEGAQAGLSWVTILKKRPAYRKAFAGFEIAKVARFRQAKIDTLVGNPGIVRNRLKIASAIRNAKATISIQKEFGSLDAYLWQFAGGKPIRNHWKTMQQVPATSDESDALSKDLKKRGFNFVGTTICYALMQAIGMVNDHTTDCFRYRKLGGGG
jgi:DNA-3-methyladenine glycosylase I